MGNDRSGLEDVSIKQMIDFFRGLSREASNRERQLRIEENASSICREEIRLVVNNGVTIGF